MLHNSLPPSLWGKGKGRVAAPPPPVYNLGEGERGGRGKKKKGERGGTAPSFPRRKEGRRPRTAALFQEEKEERKGGKKEGREKTRDPIF